MEPTRILLVGDDPLARGGLASLLAAEPGIAVVGQVAGGEGVRGAAEALSAAVVAVDVGFSPAAMEERVREVADGGLPVLALLADAAQAAAAWAAGARGLLYRHSPPARLGPALTALAAGLTVVDPDLSDALLRPPRRSDAGSEGLTPRELEVLQLLAEGLSNKAIASRLGISEHTAKFHVNAILGKLGAESRAEAIVIAARQGMVVL